MDFWVEYWLIQQAPAPRIKRLVALIQHQICRLSELDMEDIQTYDTSIESSVQDRPFKLMHLASEIRLLIYGHAMHNDGIQDFFHPLLSVCHQVRKEASPVFFRSERFPLVLQPQPRTDMIVLAFDGKTRNWFNLIGDEHIHTLRHVVFEFPPVEKFIIAASRYSIDLSCNDASDWEYQVKMEDKWMGSSLKRELEVIKKHVSPLFTERPLLAAEIREKHITMCETAIQLAQDALDKFNSTCIVDKHIKTTADALGELGGALVAVEKARFQPPRR